MKTSSFFAITAALAGMVLSSGCTAPSPGAGHNAAPICYASADGQSLRSTLLVEHERGVERLSGITEIRVRPPLDANAAVAAAASENEPRTRLAEDAELDGAGRLLSLRANLRTPGADRDALIVLEPAKGRVEITTPSTHIEWLVPRDFPWVWVPMLTDPGAGRPIATPLLARVVLRATASIGLVRRLDLGALVSASMRADQLVANDGTGATVVIGDDSVDMVDGLPAEMHLAALDMEVKAVEANAPGPLLAAAGARCGRLQTPQTW